MDKTSYVWVCGNKVAQIDMLELDMANLNGPGVKIMFDRVCRVLGPSDHIHIFSAPENLDHIKVVLFECTA